MKIKRALLRREIQKGRVNNFTDSLWIKKSKDKNKTKQNKKKKTKTKQNKTSFTIYTQPNVF